MITGKILNYLILRITFYKIHKFYAIREIKKKKKLSSEISDDHFSKSRQAPG